MSTATFNHTDPTNTTEHELAARTGQTVEILSPLDPSEYSVEDTGVIYRVKFADGFESEAFADELTFN